VLRRLAATLLGTIVGLVLGEAVLRFPGVSPLAGGGSDLFWTRDWGPGAVGAFTIDPEMGFRPEPGRGFTSRWGTLVGPGEPVDGDVKRPGTVRLLFAGDSVTRRGRIVRALRELYGNERYEWWNAGVESFSTAQEVAYYERFNSALRPDHVVLTFHPNDVQATPVAFVDASGRLTVHAPATPLSAAGRRLFLHSRLFRLVVAARSAAGRGRDATRREVEEALGRLSARVLADGAELTVLVLPPLRPAADWTDREIEDHEFVLAALERLGIRRFDLCGTVEELFRSGATVPESPRDVWHPGNEAARAIARDLRRAGFLAVSGERERPEGGVPGRAGLATPGR